jgi:hypothetical protein
MEGTLIIPIKTYLGTSGVSGVDGNEPIGYSLDVTTRSNVVGISYDKQCSKRSSSCEYKDKIIFKPGRNTAYLKFNLPDKTLRLYPGELRYPVGTFEIHSLLQDDSIFTRSYDETVTSGGIETKRVIKETRKPYNTNIGVRGQYVQALERANERLKDFSTAVSLISGTPSSAQVYFTSGSARVAATIYGVEACGVTGCGAIDAPSSVEKFAQGTSTASINFINKNQRNNIDYNDTVYNGPVIHRAN